MTARSGWRTAGAAVALLTALVSPARADGTVCLLGGPTPSVSIVRLDLPRGSTFLDLRLTTGWTPAAVGTSSSWHLAEGLGLLDARGHLVAARLRTYGSASRRTVVVLQGSRLVDQDAPGPSAPFVHTSGFTVSGLRPGTYYAVGFGSDGSALPPNGYWTSEVRVSGAVSCRPTGTGSVFDYDNADFVGGSQVSTFGAGYGAAGTLTYSTGRKFTFGLLDSAVQGAGSDRLDFLLPSGRGEVSDALRPFVSGRGTDRFSSSYMGLFPVVAVVGASFDP